MIKTDNHISVRDLEPALDKFWNLSGAKIKSIEKDFDFSKGSPVITIDGKYVTRGWTEWTMGFHYGSAILNFEKSLDKEYLNIGKTGTIRKMPVHISHMGVHDHGFNIISTFGNLLRLMNEGLIPENEWERNYYELGLKLSGAVQAARWTDLNSGGFIYSFNGPQSLFIDTVRSIRILIVSHLLKHSLFGEDDVKINLLERAVEHLKTSCRYSVYYGKGRDQYDIPGRTVHECIFNVKNGSFRGPNSQQGYSGRTTWMRGLAWAILGFTEELELLNYLKSNSVDANINFNEITGILFNAAIVTCNFYIENAASDGIPYWDSGAPGLSKLGKYLENPADPFNPYEPVDSSAAVIAAQGLLRFSRYLENTGHYDMQKKYYQAGLTIVKTLLSDLYLSEDMQHQGLILHSIYHNPNGWDNKPEKDKAPYGESSMWGDYHARELAIYIEKLLRSGIYYSYYNCVK